MARLPPLRTLRSCKIPVKYKCPAEGSRITGNTHRQKCPPLKGGDPSSGSIQGERSKCSSGRSSCPECDQLKF
eukprot:763026-Hanusia_phi.AAC.7